MITGPDPSRIARSGVIITAEDQHCFHCGATVVDPGIMWSGFSDDVFLHPACALELTIRLMRDVHEYEHRTGDRVTWHSADS
jgi:hypothetical protein